MSGPTPDRGAARKKADVLWGLITHNREQGREPTFEQQQELARLMAEAGMAMDMPDIPDDED